MATRQAWSAYLYENYGAVAVNPTKKIGLLDVLIKTGSEGILHHRSRIEIVGPMLKLGMQGDGFDMANSRLSAGLKSFEEKSVGAEGDESLFSVDESGLTITDTSSSAASSWMGAVFSGVADAHLSLKGAKALKSHLVNVKIESVDRSELVDILTSGQWLPNTKKGILKWPEPRYTGNSGREIWVVHAIMYADKVVVDVASSSDTGAQVSAPAAAVGMDVGAGLQVSKATTGSLEFKSKKGAIMFGFKAIRVQYNADGKAVRDHRLDAGHKAFTRILQPPPSDNPKAHMAGLFKDVIGGDGDGEDGEGDGMQVLEIVDATELDLFEQDIVTP